MTRTTHKPTASKLKGTARGSTQPPARTTRSRGKAHDANPAETSKQLDEQLRALGLYAAPTLGDGNCLFRALSDQLHGSPSGHVLLREQVCNWIQRHAEMYAPFCEDERGLDAHLRAMRQPATYGGHMELTSFAHMTGRDVKVVQPGLVYVIEANAFGGTPDPPPPLTAAGMAQDNVKNSREARKFRRERVKADRIKAKEAEEAAIIAAGDDSDDDEPSGPVYVAYHDWEHFSSIRNLVGPHAGLPHVRERPAPTASGNTQPPVSPRKSTKPVSTTRKPASSSSKPRSHLTSSSLASTSTSTAGPSSTPASSLPPDSIPLPPSRPSSSSSFSPPSRSDAAHLQEPSRTGYRSPKRTFDESSCSSMDAGDPHASSQDLPSARSGSAKRARSRRRPSEMDVEDEDEGDAVNEFGPSGAIGDDTVRGRPASLPSVSAADEHHVLEPTPSRSRSSSLSSAPSTPPPATPASTPSTPQISKRERKRLGLPRQYAVKGTQRSAGRIKIPGGKMKKPVTVAAAETVREGEEEKGQEWVKNGSGRMDVRGFRELKI